MDHASYQRAAQAIKYARSVGADPVERLDAAGLLVTPGRVKFIQTEVLHSLKASMDQWLPHEYLRRTGYVGPYTPNDMYRAIMSYLDDFIKKVEDQ